MTEHTTFEDICALWAAQPDRDRIQLNICIYDRGEIVIEAIRRVHFKNPDCVLQRAEANPRDVLGVLRKWLETRGIEE